MKKGATLCLPAGPHPCCAAASEAGAAVTGALGDSERALPGGSGQIGDKAGAAATGVREDGKRVLPCRSAEAWAAAGGNGDALGWRLRGGLGCSHRS